MKTSFFYTLSVTIVLLSLVSKAQPVITYQPMSQAVNEGNNVTLSVTVSTPGVQYSWEVNTGSGFGPVPAGVVYSGINASTLSITGAPASLNGNTYRCVVTNPVGNTTTTSNIVMLTVHARADSTAYRFMIGTNFDFVNGTQVQNLYYHLQFFLPSTFNTDSLWFKRMGFIAGIYQNRQITQVNTNYSNYIKPGMLRDSAILDNFYPASDTTMHVTRIGEVSYVEKKSTLVTGLYLEPTFRITSGHNHQTDLYGFGHLDILYNTIDYDTSFTYKVVQQEVVPNTGFSKYAPLYEAPHKSTEYIYQFYYGAGLMLHHRNQYVEAIIKIMAGVADLRRKYWEGFYSGDISVTVLPFNVVVGAEYRGLYSKHNPSYFNIYLSKGFNLTKLVDFVSR